MKASVLLCVCFCVSSVYGLQIDAPLGMESGAIPDSSLSASTVYDQYHGTDRARLNTVKEGKLMGAWSALHLDTNQWIQVDLLDIYSISGVATQGRSDYYRQWVTSFKINCSTDGTTFQTVQDPSTNPASDKVFPGNSDMNTVVDNTLPVPQCCRYVRLLPATWSSHISLRMELYGQLADVAGLQIDAPLGMESGAIPESSLSASTVYNPYQSYGPDRARLNTVREGELMGAWSALHLDTNQWIQVDLLDIYSISGVATQGRSDHNKQWVTSFKINCSTDGTTFQTVQDPSTSPASDKVFPGNSDPNTVVDNILPVPQCCRYVRLLPATWSGYISLRMELYGQLADVADCSSFGATSTAAMSTIVNTDANTVTNTAGMKTFAPANQVNCLGDNPCSNGATCADNQCICSDQFTGILCQEVNCNGDNPCSNGATCADNQCICSDQFSGVLCQEVNCIGDNPCSNGATCADNQCICSDQFTGILCQEDEENGDKPEKNVQSIDGGNPECESVDEIRSSKVPKSVIAIIVIIIIIIVVVFVVVVVVCYRRKKADKAVITKASP